jgi:uncharacterized protein
MELYALLAAVIFCAAFTQGVIGFGSGLVAMALIPLFMDLQDAVPIVALVGLVLNSVILVQLRAHLDRKKVLPLIGGALLGVPLGVLALRHLDPGPLKLMLGVLLIIYVATSIFGPKDRPRAVHDRWGYLAGFVGGGLGGAFCTSGPPVVLYITLKDWTPDAIKATLQAFFLAISVTQIPMLAATGILGVEHLPLSATALPVLLIGIYAGTRVYDRIDPTLFRRVILAGLAGMGVFYVVQNSLF